MSRPSPLATVSVVIPVKDDALLLRRCLTHLARQTLPPDEVVVVDNGCSDDSVVIARRYGARVVHEPEPGIPAAAAAGYDAATGDVIARCDADSAPPPAWVANIVASLHRHPQADAVTGPAWFYDVPLPLDLLLRLAYVRTYFASVHGALGHTALWGSTMGLRRSAWLRVRSSMHLQDPELHDDIDLAFALGLGGGIVYDRSLRVGVSARCVRGRAQFRRRMVRAWRTMRLNWAALPPWRRWALHLGGEHLGGPPVREGRRVGSQHQRDRG